MFKRDGRLHSFLIPENHDYTHNHDDQELIAKTNPKLFRDPEKKT